MFSVLYKTLIMFALVIVAMRIMGKRQLGQLEPSELVAAIMMSELASIPIADAKIPLHYPIGAIILILLLEMIMSTLALKSLKLRELFGGKPGALISNGRISKAALKKNRITIDELVEELRQKDITDISTVKHAIIERGGMLSAIQKPANLPIILINDGHLLNDNLNYMGVTERYIKDELKNRGVEKIEDVFLLMLDEQHNFFLYTQMDVA